MAAIKRKLNVKIHDIEVELKPLSFDQKSEIQGLIIGGDVMSAVKAAKLSVQYALKDLKGVKEEDGSDYKLQIENGKLTDECFDDISNLEHNGLLSGVCMMLLQGIPKDFVNAETGEKLAGVSYIKETSRKK